MDLILNRMNKADDGVFGSLVTKDGNEIAVTLEHAYYDDKNGGFDAKIQPGTYKCVRGTHRLEHMTQPFTTFEVTGVTGHTNILFHAGNFNNDSNGCILLGQHVIEDGNNSDFISNSVVTFRKFMDMQEGLNEFMLTVV